MGWESLCGGRFSEVCVVRGADELQKTEFCMGSLADGGSRAGLGRRPEMRDLGFCRGIGGRPPAKRPR